MERKGRRRNEQKEVKLRCRPGLKASGTPGRSPGANTADRSPALGQPAGPATRPHHGAWMRGGAWLQARPEGLTGEVCCPGVP